MGDAKHCQLTFDMMTVTLQWGPLSQQLLISMEDAKHSQLTYDMMI